jgi:TRAP-type transport system periplasmic protein
LSIAACVYRPSAAAKAGRESGDHDRRASGGGGAALIPKAAPSLELRLFSLHVYCDDETISAKIQQPVARQVPEEATEREVTMTISRRRILAGALAAPAIVASTRLGSAAPAQTLKISHQFPGGTIDEGDFRDRLCRMFAADLEKRTNGALAAQVYPNSSLMKTVAQFSAVRKGVLDLSLYPISYAGGEFAELNIGLMPGLVSSYKQGAAWKQAPVGQKFSQFLNSKGVIIVSWVWQAGGVVSRATPIVNPPDAKGMKVRGGSREMDMVLQAAGATTLSTPSNELYAAMQTGACDAAITSSTSLISFRLEEVAKSLTTGRGKSYWFMLEPLIMSKQIFDALPKDQQDAIMAIGAEMEQFGTTQAMADDQKVADVYAKKGAKVFDLDEATVDKWRAIARESAWKDYAGKTPLSAELLKLAEGIQFS